MSIQQYLRKECFYKYPRVFGNKLINLIRKLELSRSFKDIELELDESEAITKAIFGRLVIDDVVVEEDVIAPSESILNKKLL